jgi:probable F420-dependent oxidoreductase
MPRLAAPQEWSRRLRQIEDFGFHTVVVSEHYTDGWSMDALTAACFAVAHSQLEVLPLVLTNDLHHPAILAKAVATACSLSDGRLGIGLGAGWLEADYRALGVPFDSGSVRVDRLEEALQVIRGFFTSQALTFGGRYYQLDGLECLPRVKRPKILVGGGGKRVLTLAGQYADIVGIQPRLGKTGFDATAAAQMTRRGFEEKLAIVRAAGNPEIQLTCYDVKVGGTQATSFRPEFIDALLPDSPMLLRGDIEKCCDDLERWSVELGITYWNLGGNIEAVAPIVARLSDR